MANNPLKRKEIKRRNGIRISDPIFLLITWLWVKGHCTQYIAEEVGQTVRTISGHLREIRARIEGSTSTYAGKIDGVVHLDVWAYRPKPTPLPPRRPSPPKRPLLLGMMNGEGDLRLFVIARKNQNVIHALVKANVVRGAKIIANNSNLFSGLRKDGFPDLVQGKKESIISDWIMVNENIHLYNFWHKIQHEIKGARGVRNSNFMHRVREVELRWRFREIPTIKLFQHVVGLIEGWIRIKIQSIVILVTSIQEKSDFLIVDSLKPWIRHPGSSPLSRIRPLLLSRSRPPSEHAEAGADSVPCTA